MLKHLPSSLPKSPHQTIGDQGTGQFLCPEQGSEIPEATLHMHKIKNENQAKIIISFLTKSKPKSEQVCWMVFWSQRSMTSGGGVPAIGCGRGRTGLVRKRSSKFLLRVGHRRRKCHPRHTACSSVAARWRISILNISSCCLAPSLHQKTEWDDG